MLDFLALLLLIAFDMNILEKVLSLSHELIQGVFFLDFLNLLLFFVVLGEISLETLEFYIDDEYTVGIVTRLRAFAAM